MKYITALLMAVFLSATLTVDAEAQIFKKLKKKAQEALENKAEQKIDEEMQKAADRMVEDSWNTVFGDMEADGSSGINMPFAFNSNVETLDSYDFDIVSTMKITTKNSDGSEEEPMFLDMHFKEGAEYTGTKIRGGDMQQNSESLFLIYDYSNAAMIMLMESEDGKFSFAYDWKQALSMAKSLEDSSLQQQEEVDWDEVNQWEGYEKIGSKTIAGYNCDGYRMQDAQSTTEVWVTRENTYGMQSMFKANANTKQIKGLIPENYPQGMLMAMTTKNLESGEEARMEIVSVKKNLNVSYTMADYPAMTPGNMQK